MFSLEEPNKRQKAYNNIYSTPSQQLSWEKKNFCYFPIPSMQKCVKFKNLLSKRNGEQSTTQSNEVKWNMCIIIISDHVLPSFVLKSDGTQKNKSFRSTMTNKEKCVMPNSISYCWKYFFERSKKMYKLIAVAICLVLTSHHMYAYQWMKMKNKVGESWKCRLYSYE